MKTRRSYLVILGIIILSETVSATTLPVPVEQIEVAVLHEEYGQRLAWPVLSLPSTDRRQLENVENRLGCRTEKMCELARLCRENSKPLKDDPTSYVAKCPVPYNLVKEQHYMEIAPKYWFDSDKRSYKSLGGIYLFGFGQGDDVIGFDIGASNATESSIHNGRALISANSTFAAKRKISPSSWQKWPELLNELHHWKNTRNFECGNDDKCIKTIENLSIIKNMDGYSIEFMLPDGRKLQYLRANSPIPENKPSSVHEDNAYLITDIWRIIKANGKSQVLRAYTNTDTNNCETQCMSGWNRIPDVFTIRGRTFIFGPFSGGTVFGYNFIEVLQKELKTLGQYSGGS